MNVTIIQYGTLLICIVTLQINHRQLHYMTKLIYTLHNFIKEYTLTKLNDMGHIWTIHGYDMG